MKEYYLKVDNIHTIYIQETGTSSGIPILVLHGGPGYPLDNSNKNEKKFKDANPLIPKRKFRIITFHQRGCGLSQPLGSLEKNKTKYLIQDIEKIRKYLNIKKWIVEGHSWGATLGLLYAEKYPDIIRCLILTGLSLLDNIIDDVTKISAPDVYHSWLNGKTSQK